MFGGVIDPLKAYLIILSLIVLAYISLKFPNMPPKPPLDPRKFPRPPALEKLSRRLQVKWKGAVIADTKDAYWVLETHHAPSTSNRLSHTGPTIIVFRLEL